jgi:hypothetical protein
MPYTMPEGCVILEMLYSVNPIRTRRMPTVETLLEVALRNVTIEMLPE